MSGLRERSPRIIYQSSESKCEDLVEFDGSDETAHFRRGPRRGFQTRLPKVFVVAHKGEIRIKASPRKTPRGRDTINKAYSSSCNAHDLPRSVLKERSNMTRTLCDVFQPQKVPLREGLPTKMLASTAHFPGIAALRRTSDGRHYLA